MKHKFLFFVNRIVKPSFLLFALLLFLQSCQSPYNKARATVREYVLENIDDAKDFEELKAGQLTRLYDGETKKFLYLYLPYKFRARYDGKLKVVEICFPLDSTLTHVELSDLNKIIKAKVDSKKK